MAGVEIIGTVVDNGHKVTHSIEGVEFSLLIQSIPNSKTVLILISRLRY